MKQEKELGQDFEQVEFETTERKNKKWIKTLIITILLMISAIGICVYINKDSIFKEETGKVAIYKNIEFKEDLKLEAGKEINVNDYIKRVIGGELIVDEEAINKIDTKKVGETIIILSVKDANGDIQEFECKLNIIDTVKPEINGAEKEIKITAGDKVDLLKGVTAEDEIDGKLDVKVTGKYDIDKPGEYKLKYVAEDKSGNKEEKEFTLVVNKKEEKKTNVTTNKNTVTTDKNTTTTNNNTTTTKKETTPKEKTMYPVLELVLEMYERGIKFLPIDLYTSKAEYFIMEEDGIRPPLTSIPGLGPIDAESIVKARKNGEFMSIDELRLRAKIGNAAIECLKNAGVLDGMSQSNQMSLFG